MAKRLSAIFNNQYNALEAINRLKDLGYGDGDFSVLMLEEDTTEEMDLDKLEETTAPESSYTGAKMGAAVGASFTGLTAVGTLALTNGVGILASGPVALGLLSAGAAAGVGGLIGGLVGLGLSEHEAKAIDKNLIGGNIVLDITVQNSQEEKIKNALEETNVTNYQVSS